MKIAVLVLVILLRLIELAASAHAQQPYCPNCPGGFCPKPAGPMGNLFQWREEASDPGRLHLYYNGQLTGGFDPKSGQYRDYIPGKGWSAVKPGPPIDLPAGVSKLAKVQGLPCDCCNGGPCQCSPECKCACLSSATSAEPPPGTPSANYGLDLDKIAQASKPGEYRYFAGEQDLERENAFAAIGAPGLPDDSTAMRLTYVGPAATAARLRHDMEHIVALQGWRERVTVQDYRTADEPMIRGKGFSSQGIHVESAAGLPLWYAPEYTTPEDLARGLAGADLRRADPGFAGLLRQKGGKWLPDRWPDLSRIDEPRPLDGLRDLSATTDWIKRNWLALLGIGIGIWFAGKSRKK